MSGQSPLKVWSARTILQRLLVSILVGLGPGVVGPSRHPGRLQGGVPVRGRGTDRTDRGQRHVGDVAAAALTRRRGRRRPADCRGFFPGYFKFHHVRPKKAARVRLAPPPWTPMRGRSSSSSRSSAASDGGPRAVAALDASELPIIMGATLRPSSRRAVALTLNAPTSSTRTKAIAIVAHASPPTRRRPATSSRGASAGTRRWDSVAARWASRASLWTTAAPSSSRP